MRLAINLTAGTLALLVISASGAFSMQNPASAFCVEKGGKLQIVKTTDGEIGVCIFPDGTAVEEWKFFRDNQPDAKNAVPESKK